MGKLSDKILNANFPDASETKTGLVTIDAQSFGGDKTFEGAVTFNGGTAGVVAESAANDWAPATEYGLYQIAVNPEGVTYRASEAHLSDTYFEYDKWEVVGTSSGAIISEWISYDGLASISSVSDPDPTFGTTSVTSCYRRVALKS